jgi:hypothetical protein
LDLLKKNEAVFIKERICGELIPVYTSTWQVAKKIRVPQARATTQQGGMSATNSKKKIFENAFYGLRV